MSDSPSSSSASSSAGDSSPAAAPKPVEKQLPRLDEEQQHAPINESTDAHVHQQQVQAVHQLLGDVSESEEGEEEEASSDSPATSSDEEGEGGKKGVEGGKRKEEEERMEVDGEGKEAEADDDVIRMKRKRREEEEEDDDIFAQDDEEGEESQKMKREEGEESDEEKEGEEEEGRIRRPGEDAELAGDEEEEEPEEDAGPTRIDSELIRCRTRLGDEGPYFVRMPNFINAETKPFDAETYDDELEEDEVLDEESRNRIKLRMENTIRWRTVRDAEGNEKRESNAKIVRWSDGSMSMYLGKEIFEIEPQRIMDHNHLYIRQGAALQSQAIFGQKLTFRPHSTETMTHRKMTLSAAEKSSKTQKVKVLVQDSDNPETKRRELIRTEEEKLRAATRREAQQQRIRERPRMSGLTHGFLEGYDSDEGGGESLAAIKRRYQHAPYSSMDSRERASLSGSEDDGEEGGAAAAEERERKARKAINEAKIYSDEEEEEAGGEASGGRTSGAGLEDAEDSDAEQRQSQSQKQHHQKKKTIVIEEDEEDL